MYTFHKDKARYFDMQYRVTRDTIVPFLKASYDLPKAGRVLEIGCAEAGVLKAFVELGWQAVGIELSDDRLNFARRFHGEAWAKGQIAFLNKNVFDIDFRTDLGTGFDLIILKDVIEHLPEKARFLRKLKEFLLPHGRIFFAFPPWHMPFGGHQQICRNRWISKWPWIHLLPSSAYKSLLRRSGESDTTIRELLELQETRLTMPDFRTLVRANGYVIETEKKWLTNPIYKYKFGLRARSMPGGLLRPLHAFLTTAYYGLIRSSE